MQAQLARGLSAAEAAHVARRAGPGRHRIPDVSRRPTGTDAGRGAPAFRPGADSGGGRRGDAALPGPPARPRRLRRVGRQRVLDTMLRELSLTTVLRDIVMPYLAELGARWERGTASTSRRSTSPATSCAAGWPGSRSGWGQGVGPRAVIACPRDELHDLPLMVFGIVLNRCGWRVTFLGNNTPVERSRQRGTSSRTPGCGRPLGRDRAGTRSRRSLDGLAVPRCPGAVVLAGAGATAEIAAAAGTSAAARRPGDRGTAPAVPARASRSGPGHEGPRRRGLRFRRPPAVPGPRGGRPRGRGHDPPPGHLRRRRHRGRRPTSRTPTPSTRRWPAVTPPTTSCTRWTTTTSRARTPPAPRPSAGGGAGRAEADRLPRRSR